MRHGFVVCAFAAIMSLALDPAARAADMAPAYKSPVTPAASSWSGLYVGLHVGGGWSDKTFTDLTGAYTAVVGSTWHTDPKGPITGGQVGYNFQYANWLLLGAEADFSWAAMRGDTKEQLIQTSLRTDINWLATATARAGLLYNDWLFYVKGGGAWLRNPTFSS